MTRLATFRHGGVTSIGIVEEDRIVDLGDAYADMAALIEAHPNGVLGDLAARGRPGPALGQVQLLPPVPRPGKIFCVGVNYQNRNEEYQDGSAPPAFPSLFMRVPGSLVGHEQPILRPPESDTLDYEGEIVMIIGRGGRRVAADRARSHVFGLTLMNEGTIREWIRHGKFNVTQGKNFEASGSIGPWIVTRESCPDFDALQVTTWVNGEERQHGSTCDLLFPFGRIIEYISAFTTLEPGDVIATGTPPGAGARIDPPIYLQPGDVVEVRSPQIGTLRNTVMDEASQQA